MKSELCASSSPIHAYPRVRMQERKKERKILLILCCHHRFQFYHTIILSFLPFPHVLFGLTNKNKTLLVLFFVTFSRGGRKNLCKKSSGVQRGYNDDVEDHPFAGTTTRARVVGT